MKKLSVNFKSGQKINVDIVVISTGIRPNHKIAENAGIKVYYEGRGIVKSQSVRPGTPFSQASTIKLILS